uniref:Uncharacterized protein n=1 Tax=Chenopodium quinoa TaxID=63459 RepID=A0A803LM91_CHEQI
MDPLVNSLINHGNRLATLKEVAKSQSNRKIDHGRVKKEVKDLLDKLEKPQLPGSFPETIIPKIIDKIQDTVQTFIKHDSDNAAEYEKLAKEISDWKSKKQSPSTTPSVPKHPTGDSIYQHDSSTDNDHEFEAEQIADEKMKCLFCWSLFSAGKEIQRRELIYWYKMNENVRSKVVQANNRLGKTVTELKGRWSVLQQMKVDDRSTPTMSLVINKGENSLTGKTLELLNKEKNVKLTCLSLQGISGIVELPELVYKLDNLKILDLRACPNLESLSKGIESLKQLTHLDLSECYLLDHVPNGISSLTKLQVLKGFVINPEDDPQQAVDNGNGKINNNKMKKKASSMATFSDLSNLKELVKLTIRTRRMKFPTIQDFDTLLAMDKLETLGVLWVRSSSAVVCATPTRRFPKSLTKLELQAAPKDTLSSLLRCICKDKESSLQKLYIRGGQGLDLGMESMEMHFVCNVHTSQKKTKKSPWNALRRTISPFALRRTISPFARRGDGVMKHVRRCSTSFSRYSSGKIEAKLDYSSSDDEEEVVVVDPPKKVVVEVAVVLDLSESAAVVVQEVVGEKESPKKADLEKEETPVKATATSSSPRGQKRFRSVFKDDYNDWDPCYVAEG